MRKFELDGFTEEIINPGLKVFNLLFKTALRIFPIFGMIAEDNGVHCLSQITVPKKSLIQDL